MRDIAKKRINGTKDKESRSRAICEKLKNDEAFRSAEVILAFSPLESEPDITPLYDERFLFPYIKDGTMGFARMPLEKSDMGFLEPKDKTPREFKSAVMLVPGRAFTLDGKRLGRGGGWYDRFISKNREKLHTIGICFSTQIFEDIPTEEHDEKMDETVTD